MRVLKIFDGCTEEILCFREKFMGFLGIFDGFAAEIRWVSLRFLMGVLKIFDDCPGVI